MKTINLIEQDDLPKEIYSTIAASVAKPTSKKFRKNDYSQQDVMMEFAQETEDESNEEEDNDEVARYANAKITINTEECALIWWKNWAITYPKLSVLAKSLLGIPASSCTSERIFSATGRILEERRQNLNDDTVDDILFIRNFRKIVL
jgi:hypothetical protein